MSTRQELRLYQQTFDELVHAIATWSRAHPDTQVQLRFPNAEVIGSLHELPEEWCSNEAARELVLYCIGCVPLATIAMFRTCCKRVERPH